MSRACFVLVAALWCPSVVSAQPQVVVQGAPGSTIQAPPGMPLPPGAGVPPRDTPQKTGTARIRGHVFVAEGGQPLRKALVRIVSNELRENRVATTDAGGAYELKELPAGRYTLTASKGSFVTLNYGQVRPFEAGKPLEIFDGQTVEKVDFSLPRGAVITGRVFDEFGDPVADVQVTSMRYQYAQGRRQLVPSGGRFVQTNDIGEYRLFGLPPGQYYISATLRAGMLMGAESADRTGYAPTYYPGTPSATEAQRVTVALGGTVTDANIALIPTRTARITGTAVGSDGKPLAGGFVMVTQRSGSMFMSSSGGQIKADGSFTISNVAPGEYLLAANMRGGFAEASESATAQVTVAGEDVSGVQLISTKPVSVTGRLVVDPAQAGALAASNVRLTAQPAAPEGMPMIGMAPGKVNDDLTFELHARPGRALIRAFPMMGSSGGDWSLKAVRLNGVDVTDSGIDFRPNEDVADVEVVITSRQSQVTGIVKNARDEPVKDYTVLIFARDEQRWVYPTRYLGTGRPDQDGRFKVRALPPGEYYVVALDYVDPASAGDPELLGSLRDQSTTFSLDDGETKTLDLKLTVR